MNPNAPAAIMGLPGLVKWEGDLSVDGQFIYFFCGGEIVYYCGSTRQFRHRLGGHLAITSFKNARNKNVITSNVNSVWLWAIARGDHAYDIPPTRYLVQKAGTIGYTHARRKNGEKTRKPYIARKDYWHARDLRIPRQTSLLLALEGAIIRTLAPPENTSPTSGKGSGTPRTAPELILLVSHWLGKDPPPGDYAPEHYRKAIALLLSWPLVNLPPNSEPVSPVNSNSLVPHTTYLPADSGI